MKKYSGIVCLLLAVPVALWSIACVSAPKTENPSRTMLTIQTIKDHPDRYADTTVRLTGQFMGWKGSCQETPPKSRSDWMIEDGTGCMYVSGPFPKGLQPMSPKDETIELTGVVRLTTFGVPYLEAQRSD